MAAAGRGGTDRDRGGANAHRTHGPMRVAVIGAGSMGAFHAEVLGAMPDVELFVIDVDAARASMVAQRAGGSAIGLDKAMERAEALVVATPPEYHAAAVEVALERGIHILCEKPLTADLASSIEVARRGAARGAHLEVGFQRRHDPGYVALREAVSGRRIHLVRMTAMDPRFEPPGLDAWPASEVAPIFRDSSIHDFDFVRWVSGQEVESVSVEASRRDEARPDDPRGIETAIVTMRLSGGTLAVLEATWLHPGGVRQPGRGAGGRRRRDGRPVAAHAGPPPRLARHQRRRHLVRLSRPLRRRLCRRDDRLPGGRARRASAVELGTRRRGGDAHRGGRHARPRGASDRPADRGSGRPRPDRAIGPWPPRNPWRILRTATPDHVAFGFAPRASRRRTR